MVTAAATDSQQKGARSAVGPTVQSASNTAAEIFYVANINNTGETVTLTFSGTGTVTSSACVMVEYSGADTNYPLDSVSAGYSTGTNQTAFLDSGNAAPANSNLLVFAVGFIDAQATSGLAAGSGFTSRLSSNVGTGTAIAEDTANSPISGNNVLQRATACLEVVSGTCPGTAVGDWLMQMAIFRDASWTVAGGWNPARPGRIRYADQFPGIDIGDQINHAAADLLSTGGEIDIAIPASGGCYQFATPIVINGPIIIRGLGSSPSVCLIFTGSLSSSGTALTMTCGTTLSVSGCGLSNLQLLGQCINEACAGNTSVGVLLNTNGTNFFGQNLLIGRQNSSPAITGCSTSCSFFVGLEVAGTNGIGNGTCTHCTIFGANTDVDFVNGQENWQWYGGFLAQGGTALLLGGTGVADYYFYGVSFDDNVLAISEPNSNNSALWCFGCHFENSGKGVAANYVSQGTSGQVYLYGGEMLDDCPSSGTGACNGTLTQMVTVGGFYFSAFGTTVSSSGQDITQVVMASNFVGLELHFNEFNPPPVIAADYNTTYNGAPVIDCPINSHYPCRYSLPLTLANGGLNMTNLLISTTAPTIGGTGCSGGSGWGTSPLVATTNGTAAFTVGVGTGGTASCGNLSMPAAQNGWNCQVQDYTHPAGNFTQEINNSAKSVTFTNYAYSGGSWVATPWSSGDVLLVNCSGR